VLLRLRLSVCQAQRQVRNSRALILLCIPTFPLLLFSSVNAELTESLLPVGRDSVASVFLFSFHSSHSKTFDQQRSSTLAELMHAPRKPEA